MKRALTLALAMFACAHSSAPAHEPPRAADAGTAPPAAKAGLLPGEQVLSKRPEPPPLAPFDAPVPEVRSLSNGLKVYVVSRPESAIEALLLVVKRGAAADPPLLPGLASVTAEMLEAGSAGRGQAEVARAADELGATLTVSAEEDGTLVGISGLAGKLSAMTALLSDVALRPNLSVDDWRRIQARRTAELLADRARPEVAADHAFRAAVYGAHPLGHAESGTPESLKAMRITHVKEFFATFTPEDSAIVAVGGADPAAAVAALEKAFGSWHPGKKSQMHPPAQGEVPSERPRLVAVDFPGKPQSVLRVGEPSVPRSSPDYLALRALNVVLGGSFTSRLNQNLREKHGYTYGAFSRFAFGVGPGPFAVRTDVKTDATGAALKEILEELQQILSAPFSPEDLDKGKALLAAGLVQELETSDSTALAIADLFLFDLPLDEYRTFVPRLKALTVADVQGAARRALHPEAMTITFAGDVAKVEPLLKAEPSLSSLPRPQIRDADGKLKRK